MSYIWYIIQVTAGFNVWVVKIDGGWDDAILQDFSANNCLDTTCRS